MVPFEAMRKQVFVIHGGTTWPTYEDYFKYLEDYTLEHLLEKRQKRWKDLLPETLGEEYEVIAPKMPSPSNAKYVEWKLWFEKYFPILRDDIILIGHSLGAAFLVKYLGENAFPVRIKQLHLVATPIADTEKEPLCDFKFKNFELKTSDKINLSNVSISQIFIYHSKDDDVVPYSDSEKLHKALPQAEFMTFEDRGHFLVEEFSELVEKVQLSN